MNINLVTKMFSNNMRKAQNMSDIATKRLSTTKRVNSASDDPTAIGKIQRLIAQINASKYVQSNLNDATSLTKSMEKAYTSVNSNADDLIELSTKYQNGSLSASDKSSIEESTKQVLDSMVSTLANADYNGKKVFSSANYTFQAGISYSDQLTINTPKFNMSKNGDGTYNITKSDGTTLSNQSVTDILNNDYIQNNIINESSTELSSIGATQNLIDIKIDYASAMDEVNTNMLSKLEDADITKENSNLAQAQALMAINVSLQSKVISNNEKFIGTLFNSLA